MRKVYIFAAIMIVVAIVPNEAAEKRALDFHCTDRIRTLLQDSCMYLQRHLKEKAMEEKKRKEERKKTSEPGRAKREMDNLTENMSDTDSDDVKFVVQFVENESHETFMKGHRLYNVRHSTYPEGDHLILNHRAAKMLRDYDSQFKIEPRSTIYRNENGKLVKHHLYRSRRETSPYSYFERLVACCMNETECLFAFCFAGA